MNVRRWALLSILAGSPLAAADLRIYWIDVEGGAATLIVTPESETVLMGRGLARFRRSRCRPDRERAREGGWPEGTGLLHRVPLPSGPYRRSGRPGRESAHRSVRSIMATSVEVGWNERADALWQSYVATAGDRRMRGGAGRATAVAGRGFLFVAARGKFIERPLAEQGPNPDCRDAVQRPVDRGENGKSVGFLLRSGKFEFLDLGDLTWNYEIETACPENIFGEIDLYQVTHHGMHTSGRAGPTSRIRPAVAVMNNGPRKGGSPATYEALATTPSLLDLWQVHRSLGSGPGAQSERGVHRESRRDGGLRRALDPGRSRPAGPLHPDQLAQRVQQGIRAALIAAATSRPSATGRAIHQAGGLPQQGNARAAPPVVTGQDSKALVVVKVGNVHTDGEPAPEELPLLGGG